MGVVNSSSSRIVVHSISPDAASMPSTRPLRSERYSRSPTTAGLLNRPGRVKCHTSLPSSSEYAAKLSRYMM